MGDVNGDGLTDVSIATGALIQTGQWAVYIIYGRTDGAFSILPTPDTPAVGIRIIASEYGTSIGREVAVLGDINGDGVDDFGLGEPGKSFSGPFGASVGAAYVIYGSVGGLPPVDLNNLPPSVGFRIVGENAGDNFGSEVASAGDFNNDGRPDVAFGALQADFNGNASGSLYVMFTGEPPTSDVLASSLVGARGVRFDGEAPGHLFGRASEGAGDFNNDGANDLLITAQTAAFNGLNSGSAYVVFGRTSNLFRDGFENAQ